MAYLKLIVGIVWAYLANIAIGFDQQLNTFIAGEPDETMSSHAYRMNRDGKPWGFLMHIINALAFNRNHCYEAYLSEKNRMQLAPEFRE